MKSLRIQLFCALVCLVLCSACAFSQVTIGFHRVNQATARAKGSLYLVVQPNATVSVDSTATGKAAIIYSDPLLSVQIPNSVVRADTNGNYDYYIPVNYCVDEQVSYPGAGTYVTKNICENTGAIVTPVGGSYDRTGATTAGQALANLGAQASLPGLSGDGSNGIIVTGKVTGTGICDKSNVVDAKACYGAK